MTWTLLIGLHQANCTRDCPFSMQNHILSLICDVVPRCRCLLKLCKPKLLGSIPVLIDICEFGFVDYVLCSDRAFFSFEVCRFPLSINQSIAQYQYWCGICSSFSGINWKHLYIQQKKNLIKSFNNSLPPSFLTIYLFFTYILVLVSSHPSFISLPLVLCILLSKIH